MHPDHIAFTLISGPVQAYLSPEHHNMSSRPHAGQDSHSQVWRDLAYTLTSPDSKIELNTTIPSNIV